MCRVKHWLSLRLPASRVSPLVRLVIRPGKYWYWYWYTYTRRSINPGQMTPVSRHTQTACKLKKRTTCLACTNLIVAEGYHISVSVGEQNSPSQRACL